MSPAALLLPLLGLALKTSLVLAAAAGAAAALRRHSSALRHTVWVLGFVGVLALPFLEVVVPLRPVRVTSALAPAPPRSPSVPLHRRAADAPAPGGRPAAAPHSEARLDGPPGAGGAPASRPMAIADSRRTGTPGVWLLMAWATGAVVVLGRFLLGSVRLARRRRRAALVTDPAWLDLTCALTARMGVRRRVTLLRGAGPAVPMTWGVLRPTVWIPDGADAWTDERRAAVLAHELAHVRRRDALTQSLIMNVGPSD